MKHFRCDKPMAEKKHLLEICNQMCNECQAAMVKLESGEWEHNDPWRNAVREYDRKRKKKK